MKRAHPLIASFTPGLFNSMALPGFIDLEFGKPAGITSAAAEWILTGSRHFVSWFGITVSGGYTSTIPVCRSLEMGRHFGLT